MGKSNDDRLPFLWGVSTDGQHWTLTDAANNVTRIAANLFTAAETKATRPLTEFAELIEFLQENHISGDTFSSFAMLPPFRMWLTFYFPKVPHTALQAMAYTCEAMKCSREGNKERAWALMSAANFLAGRALDEHTSGVVAADEVKKNARKNALLRHAENHAMKEEVFAWLDQNMHRYKSMDAATSAIAGVEVPAAWRTVREWVTQWKKLRSTGTA